MATALQIVEADRMRLPGFVYMAPRFRPCALTDSPVSLVRALAPATGNRGGLEGVEKRGFRSQGAVDIHAHARSDCFQPHPVGNIRLHREGQAVVHRRDSDDHNLLIIEVKLLGRGRAQRRDHAHDKLSALVYGDESSANACAVPSIK